MRRVAPLLLCVLCACLPASPALDGGDADAGDAGTGPLTASDYCEATADFFCDYYLRCGRLLAATAEECHAVFLETCNARYEPRYVDLADAGLLVLSQTGIDACRAHLGTVSCEQQLTDLMGPCAQMWVGQEDAGSPCGPDVESFTCGAGTTCVLGLTFCGTCRPAAAPGGSCADGGACLGEAACVQGQCVARQQVGAACSASQPCVVGGSCPAGVCVGPVVVTEGAACGASRRCPYRSACLGGVCVRSALLGEDCSARACASGRCITEGAAKICRPYLLPGSPCTAAAECQSAVCTAGTCRSLPDACYP